MKNIDQKTLFVDSLYSRLRKEADKAKHEYNKFANLASSYITAGLSEAESVELLIIDGLDRDAAEGYVTMAQDMSVEEDGGEEYSFAFEDNYGNVFSSYDIHKVITASSMEDAWEQANELVGDDNDNEIQNIISVKKI